MDELQNHKTEISDKGFTIVKDVFDEEILHLHRCDWIAILRNLNLSPES